MADNVSLTAGMRNNLSSLQGTVALINQTQTRLSSGLKVNSALDNPLNYFTAKSHRDRAADLTALKDGMAEAIQTIKAATTGITGMTTLLANAKAIASSATAMSDADRTNALAQYNAIITQVDQMATDSGYKGTNLLASASLDVQFEGTNKLTLTGFDASTSGMGMTTQTSWQIADKGSAGKDPALAMAEIDAATATLRLQSQSMASNLSIVTARQDWTSGMVSVLQTGSDNLTLADMNEEGANMLTLQTRQSLGTTALSLSSQAASSVLRLFG